MSLNNEKEEIVRSRKDTHIILGLLAQDIRGSWGNGTRCRVKAMVRLCYDLGENEWANLLEYSTLEIEFDGRWMRDSWPGPYYVNYENMECKELIKGYINLFDYPHFLKNDGGNSQNEDSIQNFSFFY